MNVSVEKNTGHSIKGGKMKIQICSDLHLEFGTNENLYTKMVSTDADVLVLAGDISNSGDIIDVLKEIQLDSEKKVIFVPGNHDYYGSSRKNLDKMFYSMSERDIHVLIERDICIGNVCFIGSTGWWDGSNGHVGLTVKNALNDFRLMRYPGYKWRNRKN